MGRKPQEFPKVRWTQETATTLAAIWKAGGGKPFHAVGHTVARGRIVVAIVNIRGLAPGGNEAVGWFHTNGRGVVVNATNPIWRLMGADEVELLGKPDPEALSIHAGDLVQHHPLGDDE